ncbi:Vacuolar protein sorting-associated protein vps5 [Kickxella alabastrina]|uniref:Vacuolar protein sorting-associated protein vps5 n=1 Tax=Kickxella alabastrina TaxID=61397 RepID=A0ACC1INJ4_9FUNG|nr:Vacuolar protein sorting-associated protein vps5 [Kickxella alabastrina]
MHSSEDDLFGGGFGPTDRSRQSQSEFTFNTDEMNPFGDSSVVWDSTPTTNPATTTKPLDNSTDSSEDDSSHLQRRTEALAIDDSQASLDDEVGASAAASAPAPASAAVERDQSIAAPVSNGTEVASAADKPVSLGYAAHPAVQTARRVGIIKRGLRPPRVLGKQSQASFEDPLSSAAAAAASNEGSNMSIPAARASVDVAYSTPYNSATVKTRQTRSMSEARRRASFDSPMKQQQHNVHPYDQQLPPPQQQEQIQHAHEHTDRVASSPPSSQTSRPSASGSNTTPFRNSASSRAYLNAPQRRRSLDPTPVDQIPKFLIHVTEPVKVSDSLKSSYIAYKVCTHSDAPMFRESEMVVRRRYRDFDWLAQELVARHPGIIVPAIPEKQSMGRFEDEFVEARRAGLESCLMRISEHPVLWCDDVFRLFIEADDFPTKARMITENRVAAEINGTGPQLSGSSIAGGSGLFGDAWGGTKYKEKDEWFAKRMQELDAIEEELRALLRALEYCQRQRRELSIAHGELGESYLKMAGQELSKSLANGLTDMGSLQLKLKVLQNRQGVADLAAFQLTTEEYIRMIGAVRTAFSARGRAHGLWQTSLGDLIKRRKVLEGLVQHPSRASPERMSQLKGEIARSEIRTESSRNAFDDVSLILRREMARFDVGRVRDFQATIESYLVSLIETQEEIVLLWEAYLTSLANTDPSTDARSSV